MADQHWDASLYDTRHNFVTKYGEDLLDLLAPRVGERILDVGCGTGHLTARIAASGASVTGLDSSPSMLEQARTAYPEIEWVRGDVRSIAATASGYDAVFSNAVLHWVREAGAAAVSIARVLRPGGRFVAEFGGQGNVRRVSEAVEKSIAEVTGGRVPHEWYFPSIGEYAAVLESAGFEVSAAWLFDRMTKLDSGSGIGDWIRMFGGGMMPGLSEQEQAAVTERAAEKLRESLLIDGQWYVDYRRLRVVAIKNGSAARVAASADHRSAESA